MHIVIDAHLAVRQIDGVARYLIGLLRRLPSLDHSIRFTVLALPEHKSGLPREIFLAPNVSRVTLDLHGPSPRQHYLIPRLLRTLRADVYHHPQFDLPFGVTSPAVVTLHDLKYIYYPDFLAQRSRLKSWYISLSLRSSLRRAARIIAVSENTRKDIIRFVGDVEPRVEVVPHGVDLPDGVGENGCSVRPDLANDFVLFVGTRRPHKNLEGLIRAVVLVRKHHGLPVELVIAGKSYADYTAPEALVRELDATDYVHFLDFVSDEELPALYQQARVVALPSFYEGFGFPALEALAHGKPFVGSNITSIPEVVGDAGLLADPGMPEDIASKIASILSNPRLESELRRKARERVSLFSWDRVAERTLDIYLEAAAAQHAS